MRLTKIGRVTDARLAGGEMIKKLLLLTLCWLTASTPLSAQMLRGAERGQSSSAAPAIFDQPYSQGGHGAIPRTLLSRLRDQISANDFGADPVGRIDSSTAINAALSAGRQSNVSKEVRLFGGTYYIKRPLTLGPNECLVGEGRSSTIIKVDPQFDSSAKGILLISGKGIGGNAPAPCVKNLQIEFAQPYDVVASASQSSDAGSTKVVVNSPESISVGDVIVDATTNGAIPNVTYVDAISGFNISLSKALTGNGVIAGDKLHFAGARAHATTLVQGCKVMAGASPCAYPPAIYIPEGSTRWKIENVAIIGAWDGINSSAGGGGWIKELELGAFNVGIYLDNQLDFDHINGVHAWVFGQDANNIALYRNMLDGATYSIRLGKADGANFSDIDNFYSSIEILPNATNPTFVGITFDQGARLIVSGGSPTFTGGYFTSALSNLPADHCQFIVKGGRVLVTGFAFNSAATGACVSDGILNVTGGIAANLTPSLPFMKVGPNGILSVIGVGIDAVGIAMHRTAPLFSARASGVIRLSGMTFPSAANGIAVKIENSNKDNFLSGNNFGDWIVDSNEKSVSAINARTESVAPLGSQNNISVPDESVESLPQCTLARRGFLYTVSDAITSAYGSSLKGGGSVTTLAFCNGVVWTVH